MVSLLIAFKQSYFLQLKCRTGSIQNYKNQIDLLYRSIIFNAFVKWKYISIKYSNLQYCKMFILHVSYHQTSIIWKLDGMMSALNHSVHLTHPKKKTCSKDRLFMICHIAILLYYNLLWNLLHHRLYSAQRSRLLNIEPFYAKL